MYRPLRYRSLDERLDLMCAAAERLATLPPAVASPVSLELRVANTFFVRRNSAGEQLLAEQFGKDAHVMIGRLADSQNRATIADFCGALGWVEHGDTWTGALGGARLYPDGELKFILYPGAWS